MGTFSQLNRSRFRSISTRRDTTNEPLWNVDRTSEKLPTNWMLFHKIAIQSWDYLKVLKWYSGIWTEWTLETHVPKCCAIEAQSTSWCCWLRSLRRDLPRCDTSLPPIEPLMSTVPDCWSRYAKSWTCAAKRKPNRAWTKCPRARSWTPISPTDPFWERLTNTFHFHHMANIPTFDEEFGLWSAGWICRNGENKVTREKSWVSGERQSWTKSTIFGLWLHQRPTSSEKYEVSGMDLALLSHSCSCI